MLAGRTCADRGIKTTAVRDGRRNRKQACALFVSKATIREIVREIYKRYIAQAFPRQLIIPWNRQISK